MIHAWPVNVCRFGCDAGATSQRGVLCTVGKFGPPPPAGSVAAAGVPCAYCPPSTYSGAGADACQPCDPGQWSTFGVCTICAEGRYSTAPAVSEACDGVCVAGPGFGCPAGSTSPSGIQCPVGSYQASATWSLACQLCPAGRYGATVGLTTAGCTGACIPAPGRSCIPGSSNVHGTPCPVDTYSPSGGPCQPCPAGLSSLLGSNACRKFEAFTMSSGSGGSTRLVKDVDSCFDCAGLSISLQGPTVK
jgi:hypothetical protein